MWNNVRINKERVGEETKTYSNIYLTRCNFTQFIYIWKMLYMFRVVPPPDIRSAYNCIYSIWYLSHRYCYLPLQRQVAVSVWQIPDAVDTDVCAPDVGWRYHPKHVEQFPDINKPCKVGILLDIYWNICTMHGPINVKRDKNINPLKTESNFLSCCSPIYTRAPPLLEDFQASLVCPSVDE